jgi:filamentous hemagglutinin family protein
LAGVAVSGPAAAQHITVDGSLSPAQTLIGPNYGIGANLGRQVGGNLFQSFGIFGLSQGESATFSGPNTVTNVIGRVTGGSTSSINGAINSTITGANVYLINPAGIIFGPNATVNVSGSFRAASADYLRMSDGSRFQATNPNASTLTAAQPAAFGFLTATPGAIAVNGSTLGVPRGQTLGLAGGTINIAAATLQAPAGTIHVTSVASAGEIPVAPGNGPATVTAHGTLSITQNSLLTVADSADMASGGRIFVLGGNVTVDDSEINADNYGAGGGGTLVLQGDSSLALTDGTFVHAATYSSGVGAPILLLTGSNGSVLIDNSEAVTASFASGDAGTLTINTGALTLSNQGAIGSENSSSGNGGNVLINVAGQVTVTGVDSGIDAFSDLGSSGNVGSITITAGSVSITNAEIASHTQGAGNSGDVSLQVAGTLSITETAPQNFLVGIASHADPHSTGNAEDINISAANVTLSAGAEISSSTFSSGDAGSVNVNVANLLSIDGANAPPDTLTGIAAQTNTGSTGNGGEVNVTAGSISLVNGGAISTVTLGPGDAGEVNVIAGSLSIQSGSAITSNTQAGGNAGIVSINIAGPITVSGQQSEIGSEAESGSTGDAGAVSINAVGLAVADGGVITTATHGPGLGGELDLTIAGNIMLSGTGPQITAATTGSGNAGAVVVNAGSLSMTTGATISSDTTGGSGDAGEVELHIGGAISIVGTSAADVTTGIVSQANPGSTGNAGLILVDAGSLSISSGGRISSTTFGPGDAGAVELYITGPVTISGTTAPGVTTGIFSAANDGGPGNGGFVDLSAGSLTISAGGQIATNTTGPGVGGDIDLMVDRNILLTGAGPQITASSSAGGDAGSITVSAANMTLQYGASIATQAATANGGDINLKIGDFLYLVKSKITTSVLGAKGNGGNITIDPLLLVLDSSSIIAQAVAGEGGNITIRANNFLASDDSIVSASSQLGISGTIELIGPRVDLNGSLVVLSSELKSAADIARTSCEGHGRPQSSLVDAGHGGLPQDTEAAIPALYIVDRDLGRDIAPTLGMAPSHDPPIAPLGTTLHLTMGCG